MEDFGHEHRAVVDKAAAFNAGMANREQRRIVPAEVVAEIAEVGGPASADSWWAGKRGASEHYFPDEAIDWIEAIANDENPG